MKRLTAIMVCLVLGTLSGCGDTHDSLIKEAISTINEMADTCATVKDKASADAARSKIKKLGDKLKDINARGEKLGKITEDQKKKLDEKYKKDLEAALKRVGTEAQRITTVDGGGEVVQDIFTALAQMGDDKPK
jgi:hypothetical protein